MNTKDQHTKDYTIEQNAEQRTEQQSCEPEYSEPKLVKLGLAKKLTKGGIKDKKKDSWNELGFYV